MVDREKDVAVLILLFALILYKFDFYKYLSKIRFHEYLGFASEKKRNNSVSRN